VPRRPSRRVPVPPKAGVGPPSSCQPFTHWKLFSQPGGFPLLAEVLFSPYPPTPSPLVGVVGETWSCLPRLPLGTMIYPWGMSVRFPNGGFGMRRSPFPFSPLWLVFFCGTRTLMCRQPARVKTFSLLLFILAGRKFLRLRFGFLWIVFDFFRFFQVGPSKPYFILVFPLCVLPLPPFPAGIFLGTPP